MVNMPSRPDIVTDADWQGERLARTQEEYLRSFALQMPWYKSPPEMETARTPVAFCKWVHRRIEDVLQLRKRAWIKKHGTTFERKVFQHLSYKVLSHAVRGFTHSRTEEETAGAVRQDLESVKLGGVMPVYSSLHPLAAEPYQLRQTRHGPVLDASEADEELTEWFRGEPLRTAIAAFPELTRPSPEVKLLEYARPVRQKLLVLLQTDAPEEERRLQGAEVLLDAWLAMTEQMRIQDRAEAAAKEFALDGILDQRPRDVVDRLAIPVLLSDTARERRAHPLMQQLSIRLAVEDDVEALQEFVAQWSRQLLALGVASCDRPTMSMAMLAGYLRNPEVPLEEVRQRL